MSEDEVVDTRHEQAIEDLETGEALMMWLVESKHLQSSIKEGISYFESKYGLIPNVVIAHPDDVKLKDGSVLETVEDLRVATAPWCLKEHALIGIISPTWGVSR